MDAQLVQKDIAAINIRMLSCIQRLAAISPAEAMARANMTLNEVEGLLQMDTEAIESIAASGRLVFRIEPASAQAH